MRCKFPRDFMWGAATAAYQIEGGCNEDGKAPSIWDIFTHTDGKIKDGETADTACNHYHHYREDVSLMQELGLRAYRFSISWPRVISKGTGQINGKGIDFYSRLVDELLSHNIEPYITLYHWDLPQNLEEGGGWCKRDTAFFFAEYAKKMISSLGDRVKNWMTFNEIPVFIGAGYGTGVHAPGKQLAGKDLAQAYHYVLLAHGLAVKAMRATMSDLKIGIAHNYQVPVPAIESEDYIHAAYTEWEHNTAFLLEPLFKGEYPGFVNDIPHIQDNDLAIINQPLDFFGANIYSGFYVRVLKDGHEVIPYSPNYPHAADISWFKIVPQSMYWGVRYLVQAYSPKAIFITENGYPTDNSIGEDYLLNDTDRILYLRSYLMMLNRAIEEGMPVKGYFLWSLMDNFEWAEGFTKRFGLYYVDYKNQTRTPKLSAQWYKTVIKRGEIV